MSQDMQKVSEHTLSNPIVDLIQVKVHYIGGKYPVKEL